jgi:streptogramin lyase
MKYFLFTALIAASAFSSQAHARPKPRLCEGNILNVLFYGRSFNYCPPGGRAVRVEPARRGEWTEESCRRHGGVLEPGTGSCEQY